MQAVYKEKHKKDEIKTKVLAMYLPQFYEIPQNNEWWGQGFTEWTNVRRSRPYFKGHRQPRVPYKDNFYCLLDVETIRWQAQIAKEHRVDGFCIYHYWFEGIQMMEKPMEVLLENSDIAINFCDFRTVTLENGNTAQGLILQFDKIGSRVPRALQSKGLPLCLFRFDNPQKCRRVFLQSPETLPLRQTDFALSLRSK